MEVIWENTNRLMIVVTCGSPSDDSQPTSKGEHHPLLPTWCPAALPQWIGLGESEGHMFGKQPPSPKRHPGWHVHLLTSLFEPFRTASPSHRHRGLSLNRCSPASLENIQFSQNSLFTPQRSVKRFWSSPAGFSPSAITNDSHPSAADTNWRNK